MSLYKIHNRILAMAIVGRIILLSAKLVFLLNLKRLVLLWMGKKPSENKFPQHVLTLFCLGMMHILTLLFFPKQAKMIDLEYNAGTAKMPTPGRYTVSIKIFGYWWNILEKSIDMSGKGQNHLPVFFLCRFNIPFMGFKIHFDKKCNEVIFNYKNGLLVDKLRKRKEEWIGRIYWKGIFLDYFILRKK